MILRPYSQDVRSTLLAYIGKTLPLSERDEFDRRLFEDDMFSRQVEQAEFTLIEEYADRTLVAEERAIVAVWIAGSPQRQAQVAITAALRSSAAYSASQHSKHSKFSGWLWASAAAACLALLVTLPLMHRKQPAAPTVAEVGHAPTVQQPQSPAEDTILLEAHRLRSGGAESMPPATYTLHTGRVTRLQIIVPSSALATEYSIDLRQAATQATTAPVHLAGLRPSQSAQVSYIEFSLAAGSLVQGPYEADLHSGNGIYRLHFSVAYSK